MSVPLPPIPLAERVGGHVADRGDHAVFLQVGADSRRRLDEALPEGWTWSGKRVLDFGCGAGRVLRHFLPETARAEFWGCDIDEASIAWLSQNLSPPFHVLVNREAPPLDRPDGYFDMVYGISVFTHIVREWSAWLLDLHRVLKDNGLLVLTVLSAGMSRQIAGEEWDPDRVGMNVMTYGEPWDRGGPNVLLSPWWIRAHWGRAFDILHLDPGGEGEQGVVVMRRRNVSITREDLERAEAGEPREEAALRHQVVQLLDESATLRRYAHDQRRRAEDLQMESGEAWRRLGVVVGSRSWRLTAPLRHGGRLLRAIRSGGEPPA